MPAVAGADDDVNAAVLAAGMAMEEATEELGTEPA